MATIDTLLVQIDASTEALRRELARGADSVQKFSTETSRGFGSISTELTGLTRGFRAAMTIFGGSIGLSSLTRWIEQALKVTALTGDQSEAIKGATKEMEQFKAATDELAVSIAARLAPGWAAFVKQLREGAFPTAAEEADKSIQIINAEIESLYKEIEQHQKNIGGTSWWDKTKEWFLDPQAAAIIESIKNRIADLVSERAKLAAVKGGDDRQVWSPAEELALENAIASFAIKRIELDRSIDQMLNDTIAESAVKRNKLLEDDRLFLDNFIAEMNTAPQKLSSAMSAFISEVERADQIRKANRTESQVQADNVAEAKRLMEEGLLDIKDVNNVLDQSKKSAKEFSDTFIATFNSRGIQAILNGDLHGALTGLVQDFADLVLRLTILEPLAKKFAGWFTGTGGLFAGLFGNSAGPDISNAATYLAGGGAAIAGRPYIVGEEGPEWFIPNSSGTVVPNGGGRASVTQNLYFSVGLPDQWNAALASFSSVAAKAAYDATADRLNGRR